MILHVYSEIRAFFLASWALGFWMALLRAAKSPSSLVGVVGVWRSICVRLLRYLVCSFRGGCCGGILGTGSGPIYAVGTGWPNSWRNNDLSPGCNPSGTAPPSPNESFSASSCPGTMGAVAGGSWSTDIFPSYLVCLFTCLCLRFHIWNFSSSFVKCCSF